MYNICSKKCNPCNYKGYIRASNGFFIGSSPPNSLLLHYTKWQDWSPTVVSGIDSQLISSVGTSYKRVGNQVHLIINVQFVYNPLGGVPTTTIVLGNLPLPAAAGSIYENVTVMDEDFTLPPTIVPGALRIDPLSSNVELIVENSFTYVLNSTYTVQGELVYSMNTL